MHKRLLCHWPPTLDRNFRFRFLAVYFEKMWRWSVLIFNEEYFRPYDGCTSQICSTSGNPENTEQKYRKPFEEMELFIRRSALCPGLHETQMDDSGTSHQLLWGEMHPINNDLFFFFSPTVNVMCEVKYIKWYTIFIFAFCVDHLYWSRFPYCLNPTF